MFRSMVRSPTSLDTKFGNSVPFVKPYRKDMMELFIALVLFIGLIVSWLMLPSGTGAPSEVEVVSSAMAELA